MEDSLILARQLLEIIPPVMQTLASELRQTGQLLSPSQFGAMVMLHFRPCNLSELAEHQGVSLPTMSATITRLENSGLVRRRRDEADRRVVIIELTSLGDERLDHIRELLETRISAMLSGLTMANKKALAEGLEVLCQVFELEELSDSTLRAAAN